MTRANIRLLRSDPAEGTPDEALSPNLSADLQSILYHASLAPSGHNAQPWTVHVLEPEHLLIGTARARWLPAVDPNNREVLLSIGAFLENLITAAGCVGYDVDYRVIGSSPTARELVEVKLHKARPREFALEKIRLRRTVRGGHLPGELRVDDRRMLSEVIRLHSSQTKGGDARVHLSFTVGDNASKAFGGAGYAPHERPALMIQKMGCRWFTTLDARPPVTFDVTESRRVRL